MLEPVSWLPMSQLAIDQHGLPVLLAAPAVEQQDAPAEPPLIPSTRPTSMNHVEWARRMDAVREAAREFEQLTDQDLKERLRGLTSRPLDDTEITAFRADVRALQLDDLVDLLDQAERGKLRGRRTVRVVAPRGYIRKTLAALSSLEQGELVDRLGARGWTAKQLTDKFPDAPDKPPAAHRPPPPTPGGSKNSQPPAKLAEETEFVLNRDEETGIVTSITKKVSH